MVTAICARILVGTLGLLTLATSASAECAWVLWSQSVGLAGWVHITIDGWKDRETCDEERNRRIQQIQQSKGPAMPQMVLSCLPDTVDPRGLKGK